MREFDMQKRNMLGKLDNLLSGRTAITVKEVMALEGNMSESTARRMYPFVNGRMSVEVYVTRHLKIYRGNSPAHL